MIRHRRLFVFAALVVVAASLPMGAAHAATNASYAKHLTLGLVIGDDGYDTDPFFRGEMAPTVVVSKSTSGTPWWPTTTIVLSGPATLTRLNMPETHTGTVTLTEVHKPFQTTEVTIDAFGGWLKAKGSLSGSHGFSGLFTMSDGKTGPISAIDDQKMAKPKQTVAAEYPFIGTATQGPDRNAIFFGDFHVNQIETLIGGNFISNKGINTVIGDNDGHLVLMHVVGYGAVIGVPDDFLGLRVLGGTFTGPKRGDGGMWGSVRTVNLFG